MYNLCPTNLSSLPTALYTLVYDKINQNDKNYEFKTGVDIDLTKKVQKQGFFWHSLVYKV